ncbi:hypothetical protein JCM10450v2_005546 [Rhodotorula kratochvilovae]
MPAAPPADVPRARRPSTARVRPLPTPPTTSTSPSASHGRDDSTRVVVLPLRTTAQEREDVLRPTPGRKSSLRRLRRGRSEGAGDDGGEGAVLLAGRGSEDEGGASAGRRDGLGLLRQLPAAASSTSLVSRADTFQSCTSTATDDTSDHSSFAPVFAAPFSNLVAIPDTSANSRAIDLDTAERVVPPPPRPLRSVSTTIVHTGPPAKVLKRKASVTTRGRYGGDPPDASFAAARLPRTPRRPATATCEGSFPHAIVAPAPLDEPYPSYTAAAYLPAATFTSPAPAPVFATAPLDSASSASSSTEALPRASSTARHTRERSTGRARSKSTSKGKGKARPESLSASGASTSETDSGTSGGAGKTGTLRSGLLRLKKSTASLRNAFRPAKLDIPPLPSSHPSFSSTSTSSSSASAPPPVPALPLSPIRAAATQPSLVSSVAGAAVDHELEREPLSPTTPRASSTRRHAQPPPMPGDGGAHGLRRTHSKPRQHRPSTARPPAAAEGQAQALRRAASTSALRIGLGQDKPGRPDPPRRELVQRVEEWARESER